MEIVCRSEAYRRFESSSLRHKTRDTQVGIPCFVVYENRSGFEGGSCERERAFCPTRKNERKRKTAKQTIDNRLAGRAAKGANPLVLLSTKTEADSRVGGDALLLCNNLLFSVLTMSNRLNQDVFLT